MKLTVLDPYKVLEFDGVLIIFTHFKVVNNNIILTLSSDGLAQGIKSHSKYYDEALKLLKEKLCKK